MHNQQYTGNKYASLKTVTAVLSLLFVSILSATPLELDTQVLLASVTVIIFFVVNWIKPPSGPIRVFLFLLTVFTSTRYILWRASETLPTDDILPFVFGLVLFGAEIYGFVILLLSTFLSVDVFERSPQPAPVSIDKCPSVDVLIPTYNEDENLLEVTVRAATAINYPSDKLNIYVLDDGGTEQKCNQPDTEKAEAAIQRRIDLKKLCERTGATYLTREKNEHAKAGNINAALEHTHGELILILDADHVPTRDILTRTVGHFTKDEKLFLVQTPHFFLNPDPLERNLGTFNDMPSENEMFYNIIQKGLDGYNASFFCGSAAILRRKYILEIGGIQGDTITEDAETALELHSRGYRSAYVAQPMVAGLSPETFSGFIVQRMRWAQGMAQIFILKNPLLKKGLSLSQRLGYLNSCFFWFFPLARMAFVFAPLLYLILGIQVYDASFSDFVAYGGPHIVGAILLSSALYGKSRWVFASELYEIIQSVHCAGAILEVFRNPRAPTFAVTPKGEDLDTNFISPLALPFYWIISIVLLGEIAGIIRMVLDPQNAGFMAAGLMWNTFHLILLLGALGVLFERSQRRAFPRIERNTEISIIIEGESFRTVATDLSVHGMGIEFTKEFVDILEIGESVQINAKDLGSPDSRILDLEVRSVFQKNGKILVGLSFKLETAAQWKAIVSLVYSNSKSWSQFQEVRSSSNNMFGSVYFLIRTSVVRAFEHLTEILRTVKI